MRVLAIDPALRNTGYGVVERVGKDLRHIASGVIKNHTKLRQTECLVANHRAIADLVAQYAPQSCAVEGIIFVQSYRTAITMGAARGSALLAMAQAGLPIHEYAPKRVKQAVVGKGGAQKDQVSFMVRALLGMTETPPHDAADALAIAITHLQALASPATMLGDVVQL